MNWVAVALGGAVGASMRYAIAIHLVSTSSRFPFATFIANSVGCFLMGIGYVVIVERAHLPEPWRQLLLVGVLGALTTFSTFAIETLSLIDGQFYKLAALYVVASLVVCLIAVALGALSARTLF